MLSLLLACAEPPPPSLAPETHSWKEEGQLVVDGLDEVERLWKAGNKDAAKVLAERVYTERWEPRLEPAARQMDAAGVIETEYGFSLLLLELDGQGRDIDGKVHSLEEKARAVAESAARTFPPPGTAPEAPPAAAADGSHPIVPDVKPAWESPGG